MLSLKRDKKEEEEGEEISYCRTRSIICRKLSTVNDSQGLDLDLRLPVKT